MAAEYNININKHSTFSRGFQVKENDVILDLSGYSVAAALKENFRATTSTDFTVAISDASQGLFNVSLTDAQTGALDPGTWRYDIVMTDSSGNKTRLLEGRAFINQGVTV
jgi:hypothetical protein